MAGDVIPNDDKPIFAPKRSLAARAGRVVAWLVALVALYAAAGFLGLPGLLKWQLPKQLGEQLGREVTLDGASFNPFTLEARLSGLTIRDGTNAKPLFAFGELYVDAAARSLIERALVLTAVRLTRPQVSVIRLDANRYNFSDIIDRFTAKEGQPAPDADSAPFRFAIGNIEILDGEADFDDRPEHVNHTVRGLALGIPFVSNFPAHIETRVEPRFEAAINNDPVRITGESRPFKDTHETLLNISLADVHLPRYVEYVPADLDFRVPSALLGADLVVRFAQHAQRGPELTIEGKARISKLAITDRTGAPLLGFAGLDVELERFDLAANRLALGRVTLDAPSVNVHRDAGGRINLEHLAPRMTSREAAPSAAATTRPFAFELREFTLRGGEVAFADDTNARPFRLRAAPIDATVSDFSLSDATPAKYTVAVATDLKTTVKSTGQFALEPLAASGRVELAELRPSDFAPWYERLLAIDIAEGSLNAAADYRFAMREGNPVIEVAGASLGVQSLRVVQRSDRQDLARVGKLEVTGVALDPGKQSISIDNVQAVELRALVQRLADGSLNVEKIVAADPAGAKVTPAPPQPAAPARPWTWTLKQVAIERSAARFTDATTKPAADLTVDALQASIENIASAKGTRSAVQVRAQVNKSGTVAARGTMVIDPLALDLTLDAGSIGIPAFEPYYASLVNLNVGSGAVTARGKVAINTLPSGAPAVKFAGDVTVSGLATTDRGRGEDLLKWRSLYLGQVDVATEPLAVSLAEVALTDFFSRVVIFPDGRLNLQNLMAGADGPAGRQDTAGPVKPPSGAASKSTTDSGANVTDERTEKPAADSAGKTPPAATPAPQIRIGRVTFQEGNVAFSDFFIKPNYSANLTQITGSVSAITPDRAGDVDVRGRINNTGSLEVAGQVNPLAQSLFLDLKAAARDIDLPAMTPYSAKYVGYGIEKGKLSLNVSYRLENNQLAAENNLTLDQLTFGERVEGPDVPNLPVNLAVALLKDRNGVIDIQLPISGSLDDPQFSIGGLIARVIVNLIVKAVTSPFALIASVFGGSGGEELGFLEFDPGSAAIGGAAAAKLKTLARALEDRPGLKLDVNGRIVPDADREALRRIKLNERVRAEKIKGTASDRNATVPSASITVSPDEYPKWLGAAYRNATFERPRNVIGILREQPLAEMERLLLANTDVTDDDLRALANSRAQAAKDHLVSAGGVTAERIFLVAPKAGTDDLREKGDKGAPTRVDFALR